MNDIRTAVRAKAYDRLDQQGKAAWDDLDRRFSAAMAPVIAKFAPGRTVSHPTFGRGVVIHADEHVIAIAFDTAGPKKICTAWCKENLMDDAPGHADAS